MLDASHDHEKRCGLQITSDDIQSAVVAQVPLNTKRNKNWTANTWQAWAIACKAASSAKWVNQDLNSVTDMVVVVQISCFMLEVRNKDGEHYPPNTLYSLQHQLCEAARCVNILKDAWFWSSVSCS